MTNPTVTVLVTSFPPRTRSPFLKRALESILNQTRLPDRITLEIDLSDEGARATRSRGLESVTTDYVAFLDDDDELLENHLASCIRHAIDTKSDVVYPGCKVIGPQGQVLPHREEYGRYGKAFDPELLRKKSYIPVTSLVKTDVAKSVGGFTYPKGSKYEDWGFYLKLLDAGAKFSHLQEVTWLWHHHGKNTSGRSKKERGLK